MEFSQRIGTDSAVRTRKPATRPASIRPLRKMPHHAHQADIVTVSASVTLGDSPPATRAFTPPRKDVHLQCVRQCTRANQPRTWQAAIQSLHTLFTSPEDARLAPCVATAGIQPANRHRSGGAQVRVRCAAQTRRASSELVAQNATPRHPQGVRMRARPTWRGGCHFHQAGCLPLLSLQ